MAAVGLRADHWQVHHLGTEVPVSDVVTLAAAVDADLVVLSTTCDPGRPAVAEAIDDIKNVGVRVLAGGAGTPVRRLIEEARE